MEAKKRTIFSNYYSEENFKAALESLVDIRGEDAEISDNDIWDEYNFMLDSAWEDEKLMLETVFDGSKKFLLKGTIQRWDGPSEGGFIFSTLDEMARAWQNCDFFHLYDANGHFFVDCSHHDGTNHYEVKQLTEEGVLYEENHPYLPARELHTKIWNSSKYSKLIHYAHRKFGCKKVEYAS